MSNENPRTVRFVEPEENPVVETPVHKPDQTEDLSKRWYSVTLPSKGMLGYPAEVKYRDILVRDEKILATTTLANFTKTLNELLKSLLGNPTWFDQLTVHDRDFLLVYIWANNYSPEKNVKVKCSNEHCQLENNVVIDLTKLDVNEISDRYKEMRFKTKFGKEIGVRLATVKDQITTEDFLRRHKDEYDFDTVFYSLTIDTGNVLPLDAKIRWVEENVTGKDMARVRMYHEYFKYGLDDMLEMTCRECGEVTHYQLPFRPEWLRPTPRENFEELLFGDNEHEAESGPTEG